jgi:hypothetical protein
MSHWKLQEPEHAGGTIGWRAMALNSGFACIRCGSIPAYDEREIFLETEFCELCAHQARKDSPLA